MSISPHPNPNDPNDKRRVALIKSLATNNRFYVLVADERGICNADTVAQIPDDLLLGIAYPCLEDGLNDFAVIRTTFETLEYFSDEDPVSEMMEIINDARGNLVRRLEELRDKIAINQAHFLGTEYEEFQRFALVIARKGYPRRNLDSMMKLNVFASVAEAEGYSDPAALDYRFEFCYNELEAMAEREPRSFLVGLFDELLSCVQDEAHYKSKYLFDRNVFQKFIAVMFINYATTDPMFYGINKRDYGVSAEKDMENTPLYQAIGRELRAIEERLREEGTWQVPGAPVAPPAPKAPLAPVEPDFSAAVPLPVGRIPEPADGGTNGLPSFETTDSMLPGELVNEEVLLGLVTSVCSAAQLLQRKSDPETQRFAHLILTDASKLVQELKRLGIVSSFVTDPGTCGS
ncbi:MAG TPA: hypothetical protein VKU00_17875 [Chthonomonadaceae bacterium]|nr:hypothetical protein [Chthonomonadaceae bacterium]